MRRQLVTTVLVSTMVFWGNGAVADTGSTSFDDAPTAVEGKLTNDDGQQVTGVVEVMVWPTDSILAEQQIGGSVDVRRLTEIETDSNGRFSVPLSPDQLSESHITDDGRVDLELRSTAHGLDGPRTIGRAVTVQWVDIGTTAAWVDPLRVEAINDLREDGQSVIDMATYAVLNQHLPLEGAVPRIDLDDPTRLPASGGSGSCATKRISTDAWHSDWADVWPSGGVMASANHWSNHAISLGVAVKGDGKYGYASAGSKTIKSEGSRFGFGRVTSPRWFRIHTEYGQFKTNCVASYNGKTWETESYEWRPLRETGGYASNYAFNSQRPSWSQCVTLPAGTWSRNSSQHKATTFSAGVKAKSDIGLDLSVKTNYGNARTINYTEWYDDWHICGSNDWPKHASRVGMRP